MDTASPLTPDSPQNVLIMPKASRAFLVGMTGTGKSTLGEVLMNEYKRAYSSSKRIARTLIVDTKPRWRAEKEINGIPTSITRRYSKWGYGSGIIPKSFALSGASDSIGHELDQVWRLGGEVAIAHAETEDEWPYVSEVATRFYERYGADTPRLIFVDELADFFKFRSLGDIFQRISRNGRERNVALIAGSQRPRKVPLEIMTEMTRLYMFKLDFREDIQRILQFGIPEDVVMPDGFNFYMYDRKLGRNPPSDSYYALDLSKNIYTGEPYDGEDNE